MKRFGLYNWECSTISIYKHMRSLIAHGYLDQYRLNKDQDMYLETGWTNEIAKIIEFKLCTQAPGFQARLSGCIFLLTPRLGLCAVYYMLFFISLNVAITSTGSVLPVAFRTVGSWRPCQEFSIKFFGVGQDSHQPS